jgi:molybdenum cofactor cytidylyltransferase
LRLAARRGVMDAVTDTTSVHRTGREVKDGVSQGPVVVVLAAGRGARFGGEGHELAQTFGVSTVLGTTLAHAVQSQLAVVVVTTEALLPFAAPWLAERDIVLLPPVDAAGGLPLGMGYSIAAGVAARAHAPGWLLLPGDMPMIQPGSLRAVVRAMPQHPVVYAQHQGRRGHPVGFGVELYSELATLSGDEGARRLIARYPAHGVEVGDAGVLMDLDTPGDLDLLRERYAARHGAPAAGAAPATTSRG